MLHEEPPDVQKLEAIAMRTCAFICAINNAEEPADLSDGMLRRFFLSQDASVHEALPGLLRAGLRCAEELSDLRSGCCFVREALMRVVEDYFRKGIPIPIEIVVRLMECLQRPLAVPHPRVFVFRSRPMTRITKAFRMTPIGPDMIAWITEPFPESSPTFRRALERGRNRRQATSNAFSQARNTARARLKAKSADRIFVWVDSEAEQREILQKFARQNGYQETDILVKPGPPRDVSLPWALSLLDLSAVDLHRPFGR